MNGINGMERAQISFDAGSLRVLFPVVTGGDERRSMCVRACMQVMRGRELYDEM